MKIEFTRVYIFFDFMVIAKTSFEFSSKFSVSEISNMYIFIAGYATTVYISGIIDSTIVLNCSIQGLSPQLSIIWIGPPKETYYSMQDHIYLENIPKDLKPRLRIVGNFRRGFYNLQIKDLHFSDTGFYICHQFRSSINNEYFYLDVIGMYYFSRPL